jgi:hypothetical protein
MDVLSASSMDNKIAWYENDGSESFTEHVISTAAGGAISVYAADVDSDGDMDVLSASYSDNKITWYNNGFITMVSHTPNQYQQNVMAGTDIVVTFSEYIDGATINENSFNVDGMSCGKILGVYSVSGTRATFAPYEGEYGETFTVTLTTDIKSTEGLALNSDYTWQFTFQSKAASGFFLEREISTLADSARNVHAADVDDDGDMDVLSASGRKISWYENDGAKSFTEHVVSNLTTYAYSVYAADIDGDGDMDVLSASNWYPSSSEIAWYENDGSQSFSKQAIAASTEDAQSIYAADVDGDGDMDVLVASFNDDTIAWYENDGAQSFTERNIPTTSTDPLSIYMADIDGDGDMDVLSAFFGSSKIVWYENNGVQSFTERTISTSAMDARHAYAADVDGDGDMDVLSASSFDNKIAWYKNDGSQNFTEYTISDTAYGARSVYAADVNGDGDMDVLSASSTRNKIAWYVNDGSENFTEDIISSSAYEARSVYAADIDGDGDLDVLSASHNDDKIAWYENDPTYTLTYTAGANGTISGTSPQTVNHGSDGSAVKAVPDTGYQFVDWSDGSSENPRTDENVTADTSVTANFDVITEITDQNHINGANTPPGIVPVPNPVTFGASHIDILVNAGKNLSAVRLALFDPLGNLLHEQNNPVSVRRCGNCTFIWNLRNVNGVPVAPGTYKVLAIARYKDGAVRKFTSLIGVKK